MTLVAILGANGHIGSALAHHYAARPGFRLELYSRQPMSPEFSENGLSASSIRHRTMDELERCQPDILVNAIGIGDPARARKAGAAFYDLTMRIEDQIDRIADTHPSCLTVFLSSGAIYGAFDSGPVDEHSPARVALNGLRPQDWYGAAKIAAELRHRAQPNRRMLDIRVFGFVSRFLDLSTGYLVCDIVNAIKAGRAMKTNAQDIVRDYIGPAELAAIVDAGALHGTINRAVDTYSREPVGKFALLESLREQGLAWSVEDDPVPSSRGHYWSRHRGAEEIGYSPTRKAADIVGEVVRELVGRRR